MQSISTSILSFASLSLALFSLTQTLSAQTTPYVVLNNSGGVGTGASATFTISVSDPNGTSSLTGLNVLINSAFDGATGCWMYYDFASKQLSLNGDNGWGTASSRCSASVQPVTTISSQILQVPIAIQFSTAWAGAKTIWASANDSAGNNSGYGQIGTFTVTPTSAPDFSATPINTSQTVIAGGPADFSLSLTALNGYHGTITCSTQLSGPGASSIRVSTFQSETLPITVINPPIQSTVAFYELFAPAATPPGTVTATVTLTDGTITHILTFTLIVKSNATPIVSIAAPSQTSPNFTLTATDPNGFQSLSSVNFLMNTSLNGTNSCWLSWTPAPNAADGSGTLAIASDDTSSWAQIAVGPLANLSPLGNSQCSLPAGSVKSTGSGATLTLQFAPQFSSLFTGAKSLYADATDQAGPTTGYLSEGTWNAAASSSAGADFQIAVTPASQTISEGGAATFSATVSPFAGFTGTVDFNVTGMPAGSTVTPPPSVAPGTPAQFSVQTSTTTPTGSYPLTITGTSGTLSHSAQVQLRVYGGVPTTSLTPAGSLASPPSAYAWMYLANDPRGSQNVASLDILFNNRVDGQHACWIYFDGVVPWLASDDGAAWTRVPGGPGIAENSQCTANFGGIVPGAYFGAILTISFKTGFAPTNLYEDAVNKQGGDSGYVLQSGIPNIKP